MPRIETTTKGIEQKKKLNNKSTFRMHVAVMVTNKNTKPSEPVMGLNAKRWQVYLSINYIDDGVARVS